MLHEKSLLVYLSFGQPKLRCKDPTVSAEVKAAKGAADDAGDFIKYLYGDSYRPIAEFISQVRTYHYGATLPWLDSGMRILASAKFMEYTEKMRAFRTRWDALVSAFLDSYDQMRLAEEVRMAGLLDTNDYPTRAQLEQRFRFDVQFYPVPTANDFRVEGIEEAELDRIKRESANATEEAGRVAMQEAYARLAKIVKAMAETLSNPGKTFRDSLVENVREAVELMPAFNVTGDPAFDVFLEEAKTRLAVNDPEALRKDPVTRAATAAAANEIFARMSAYM